MRLGGITHGSFIGKLNSTRLAAKHQSTTASPRSTQTGACLSMCLHHQNLQPVMRGFSTLLLLIEARSPRGSERNFLRCEISPIIPATRMLHGWLRGGFRLVKTVMIADLLRRTTGIPSDSFMLAMKNSPQD